MLRSPMAEVYFDRAVHADAPSMPAPCSASKMQHSGQGPSLFLLLYAADIMGYFQQASG